MRKMTVRLPRYDSTGPQGKQASDNRFWALNVRSLIPTFQPTGAVLQFLRISAPLHRCLEFARAVTEVSPTAHFSLAVLNLLAGDAAAADSAFAQAVQCDASLTVVREQMEKILAELQD